MNVSNKAQGTCVAVESKEVRVESDTPNHCVPLGLLPEQEQEGERASKPSFS